MMNRIQIRIIKQNLFRIFKKKREESSMNDGGRVIICNESPYDGRWFYVKNGTKEWITSIEAAKDNGINISNIELVSVKEANKYINGKYIIRKIKSVNEITNYIEARSYFTKDLKGYGIEFGAASMPCHVPDDCKVDYADFFQIDEGCNAKMTGDFVPVKYFTSLDEMKGIESNFLDFIINCHVIEHVPRTLLALKLCFDRLKEGGVLFMAVPHMVYTFDSLRPLTTIEHFIQDYVSYCKERDLLHIVDFLEHTTEYDARKERIKAERINIFPLLDKFLKGEKVDIHYHTFTEQNFTDLLDYFNNNIARWNKTEVIPRVPFKGSNEFYVRLTK